MTEVDKYILRDYTFLQDYIIVDQQQQRLDTFIAKIKDTDQYVQFYKTPFRQQLFNRFENLVQLFNQGIILADNIFILEEAAYTEDQNSRFQTLHTRISKQAPSNQNKKVIFDKVKVLLDCLHQTGQPYAGLTSSKIIIDQEDNVFFSPFPLSFELKTDRYSSAYYCPQLLQSQVQKQKENQTKNINENVIESDKKLLINNDIWAFGCIGMQIYEFCTPIFYTLNNGLQLQIIRNFQLNHNEFFEFQTLDLLVSNLLLNCLEADPGKRKLTSQRDDQVNQFRAINRQPISNGQGDSELIFHCLCLTGIEVQKQIRINVYIDKQYSLFVSKENKHKNNIYEIDRKIYLKANFSDLYSILSQPLLVQLIENEKRTKIRVNISTLIFFVDKKRTWEKPLIGSYSAKGNGDYPQAKIKLNCQLKTPPNFQFDSLEFEECEKPKIIELKAEEETENKQKTKKANPLSAINTNLSELTMKWKQKWVKNDSNFDKQNEKIQSNRQISEKVKKILLRS